MTKMFYPNPGDTIVCNNGEKYICVSEKDYPYTRFNPGMAIYGIRGNDSYHHMYWKDNSGSSPVDNDYSIKEVIPQNLKRRDHADLIIAWANGAEIEYFNQYGGWMHTSDPSWDKDTEYRIKPAPKPNAVKYAQVNLNHATIWSNTPEYLHNLKITFDGETGKPIYVELIGD